MESKSMAQLREFMGGMSKSLDFKHLDQIPVMRKFADDQNAQMPLHPDMVCEEVT